VPDISSELESLRRENARLRKLLKLTDAEAAPAHGTQSAWFDRSPGPVDASSSPQAKVEFYAALFGARRDVVRDPVGERPLREVWLDACGCGWVAQGQQVVRSPLPPVDARGGGGGTVALSDRKRTTPQIVRPGDGRRTHCANTTPYSVGQDGPLRARCDSQPEDLLHRDDVDAQGNSASPSTWRRYSGLGSRDTFGERPDTILGAAGGEEAGNGKLPDIGAGRADRG